MRNIRLSRHGVNKGELLSEEGLGIIVISHVNLFQALRVSNVLVRFKYFIVSAYATKCCIRLTCINLISQFSVNTETGARCKRREVFPRVSSEPPCQLFIFCYHARQVIQNEAT
jgi:hypothetical protein